MVGVELVEVFAYDAESKTMDMCCALVAQAENVQLDVKQFLEL